MAPEQQKIILLAETAGKLGDEQPETLRKAVKELWETVFLSHPTVKHFLRGKPNLLETSYRNLSQDLTDDILQEAGVIMNEFNLPPRTRKVFLLSLLACEWLPGKVDKIKPGEDFSDAILDVLRNSCINDFEGKLPSNTAVKRARFLFNLVSYLIQYNAAIYPEEIGWNHSRQLRKEIIEREKESGQKFMTIFL